MPDAGELQAVQDEGDLGCTERSDFGSCPEAGAQ
jgi:hypothetical protein